MKLISIFRYYIFRTWIQKTFLNLVVLFSRKIVDFGFMINRFCSRCIISGGYYLLDTSPIRQSFHSTDLCMPLHQSLSLDDKMTCLKILNTTIILSHKDHPILNIMEIDVMCQKSESTINIRIHLAAINRFVIKPIFQFSVQSTSALGQSRFFQKSARGSTEIECSRCIKPYR